MAANHNTRGYRRNDPYNQFPPNPAIRSSIGGQGPQQMQMYPHQMHPALYHQQLQMTGMQPNYMPNAMPDGRQQYMYPPHVMQPSVFYQGQGGPYMMAGPQMMSQQQQSQPQPPHQMTSHSAHSSPTPPIHPQQQQQQQQPPQQQAPPAQTKPVRKSAAIKIVDPNTNQEVDLKQEVGRKEPAPAPEPTHVSEQSKEQRRRFEEQVRGAATKGDVKSAPHTPKHETRVHAPIEIKKPATPSPVKQQQQQQQPLKPQPAEPPKTITPKSILPRSNSQTEDKTPEKSAGIEMSVQTTPSLKKMSPSKQQPAPAKIPAPPKFDSPPKVTETKPEEVKTPVSETPVTEESPEKTETDAAPEIIPALEKKLEGETIIIDSSAVKAKVNGVSENVDTALTIDIPNGQELAHDDILSSEESSECKDQFETPPATPSEVKPEIHEPEAPKKSSPDSFTEATTPTDPPKPVEPEAPEPVQPEPVKPEPEKIVVKEPAAATAPETLQEEEEEMEEGELPAEPKPRRYTRDEMMVLREAQDQLPAGIPKYECIMDKPILKPEAPRPRSNNQFVPAWEQGNRNRSRGGDRNRSMGKEHSSMMKPRIIEHVMVAPVTRKKSANAWLSKREDDATGENKAKQDALKTLRGNIVAILNKITPQNFKELSVQIMQMNIDNTEKLDLAVEIIFEKAVLEPAFSQTYANLCKIMGCIKFPDDENPKVSPFRKTLLNRCQKEFYKEKDEELKIESKIVELKAKEGLEETKKHQQMEELLFQRSKLKKKMLGNINFIGELFNLNMISSRIILEQCVGNILEKMKVDNHLDEESIECLAKLFATVGSKLEAETKLAVDTKVAGGEDKKMNFENKFAKFKSFATDKNYPYRIRFMVQDVVDLRENDWVPRRVEAKPQRIEDIHRAHAREEQEKKMEAAVAQQSRKTKSRTDSRDDRDRGRGGSRDKAEWNPPTKKITANIDISKLSGANQKVDSGSLILGPGRAQWGRGSGTGSGANSPLSGSREDLTVTSNRFDMLKDKKNLLPGRTNSAPAPRGKNSERERSAAIANARAISGAGKRTPSHSPVRRTPEKEDSLTSDQIRQKTKSILTEYFDLEEVEEAVECVRDELKLVKKHHIFVEESINIILESKSKTYKMLGDLFAVLFAEKPPLMHADGLLNGFQLAFESAQDLAIDVPAVYSIFGKLLGKCYADEHITLKLLKGAMGPLKQSGKAGDVMCEVITNALECIGSKGRMEIQQRWGKEKMTWSEICDNHRDLIEKYKLDFLSSSAEPKESPGDSDICISHQLRKLLDDEKSTEDIFTYIDKTIPADLQKEEGFIKDLMSVACEFSVDPDPNSVETYIISEAKFKRVSPILMKYIQSSKDNLMTELHALDAVQLFVHNRHHPRSLGYDLFVKLDEEDIVLDDGFRNWRDNGHEQQGNGVMRQKLKQFFLDLSEGEESDTNSEYVGP